MPLGGARRAPSSARRSRRPADTAARAAGCVARCAPRRNADPGRHSGAGRRLAEIPRRGRKASLAAGRWGWPKTPRRSQSGADRPRGTGRLTAGCENSIEHESPAGRIAASRDSLPAARRGGAAEGCALRRRREGRGDPGPFGRGRRALECQLQRRERLGRMRPARRAGNPGAATTSTASRPAAGRVAPRAGRTHFHYCTFISKRNSRPGPGRP